jgi:Pyrimidine dimer DNA glycosylase
MRLWSIHPKYLDVRGLTAVWREGLLARKVLLGETRGYRSHPQLERFLDTFNPVLFVETYLMEVCNEATLRGHRFDRTKIGPSATDATINVTTGQLLYEMEHLLNKLRTRDQSRFDLLRKVQMPVAHPLFKIVDGDVHAWERQTKTNSSDR